MSKQKGDEQYDQDVEQKLDTETITKALAAMTPEQKQLIGGLIIGVQLAGQMNRKEDH